MTNDNLKIKDAIRAHEHYIGELQNSFITLRKLMNEPEATAPAPKKRSHKKKPAPKKDAPKVEAVKDAPKEKTAKA